MYHLPDQPLAAGRLPEGQLLIQESLEAGSSTDGSFFMVYFPVLHPALFYLLLELVHVVVQRNGLTGEEVPARYPRQVEILFVRQFWNVVLLVLQDIRRRYRQDVSVVRLDVQFSVFQDRILISFRKKKNSVIIFNEKNK